MGYYPKEKTTPEGSPEGVAKEPVEAAKWYRKAAEQGNAAAQSILGMMYSSGLGVPKDEMDALAWSNVAAARETKVRAKIATC